MGSVISFGQRPCLRMSVWLLTAGASLLCGTVSARSSTLAHGCDRQCLRQTTDRYLDAVVAHDPSQVNIAPGAKATENTQPIKVGEGLWKTATRIGSYRIYMQDPEAQQAAFTGVVFEGDQATMLMVRLKVAQQSISEIETIVTRHGFPGAAGLAPGKLTRARAGFGRAVPAADRLTRAELQSIGNAYYDAIEASSSRLAPFATDCQRVENGVAVNHNEAFEFAIVSADGRKLPAFGAMGCAEQFDAGLWSTDTVTGRRFPIIDPERGLVLVIASYNVFAKASCADTPRYGRICPAQATQPVSLDVAELFHVTGRRIHEIESAWTAVPYLTDMGW